MDYNSIISSIAVGLFTSFVVAKIFYHLGRIDTESAYRRIILTLVDMRLRQMVPTSREHEPEHYDLRDTEHWLTCLSEVLTEVGFREDADCIKTVLGEIKDAPHIPLPNEQQRAEGEAKKKKWEADLQKRIEALK